MDLKNLIVDILHHESVVIEAGACDGSDTFWLSEIVKNGMVYSFEPVPDLYEIAVSRVGSLPNVKLHKAALSDSSAPRDMHISDRYGEPFGSSSLFEPHEHLQIHKEITFNKKITVPCMKLDDLLDMYDIKHVDLIWIDIQGAEHSVFHASPNIMKITKYIHSEVSLKSMYANTPDYRTYRSMMSERGFDVVSESLPWDDMGNVLFKNRAFQ